VCLARGYINPLRRVNMLALTSFGKRKSSTSGKEGGGGLISNCCKRIMKLCANEVLYFLTMCCTERVGRGWDGTWDCLGDDSEGGVGND
jgi:hypothetical protein